MKRKWLSRKPSPKQVRKLQDWHVVCISKKDDQMDEKGFTYCELCGKVETQGIGFVWGHHKDRKRNNNTKGNCELDHWVCHQNMYHGGTSYNPFI